MQQMIFEELANSAPVTFAGETGTPALEALYMHYIECYPLHSDESKRLSAELNRALEILQFPEQDRIFTMSSQLAAEHERLAFIEGVKLGAQLMRELRE